MSKQTVTKVLERAIDDQTFATQLKTNFDAAIKGYDLTADEIAALKNTDESALRAMGVEERLSKSWLAWR
jgi:hypothetical protein